MLQPFPSAIQSLCDPLEGKVRGIIVNVSATMWADAAFFVGVPPNKCFLEIEVDVIAPGCGIELEAPEILLAIFEQEFLAPG